MLPVVHVAIVVIKTPLISTRPSFTQPAPSKEPPGARSVAPIPLEVAARQHELEVLGGEFGLRHLYAAIEAELAGEQRRQHRYRLAREADQSGDEAGERIGRDGRRAGQARVGAKLAQRSLETQSAAAGLQRQAGRMAARAFGTDAEVDLERRARGVLEACLEQFHGILSFGAKSAVLQYRATSQFIEALLNR